MRRKLFVLSAAQLVRIHVVLQFLDWSTTLFMILSTSTAMEANPVIRFILDSPGGIWWFTAIKLSVCGIIGWIIPKSLEGSPGCAWVWRALAIFYLIVVLNNSIGIAMLLMLENS